MNDALTPQRRDRSPVVTKIILLLVFLLGVAVILMGIAGIREYAASGFSSGGVPRHL